MKTTGSLPLSAKIIGWIARIWSIFTILFILLAIFFSDPGGAGSGTVENIIMLILTGSALLGLLLAWRWNGFGALFSLVILFLQELIWGILKSDWFTGLILWVIIAPPVILFLITWGIGKRTNKSLSHK